MFSSILAIRASAPVWWSIKVRETWSKPTIASLCFASVSLILSMAALCLASVSLILSMSAENFAWCSTMNCIVRSISAGVTSALLNPIQSYCGAPKDGRPGGSPLQRNLLQVLKYPRGAHAAAHAHSHHTIVRFPALHLAQQGRGQFGACAT